MTPLYQKFQLQTSVVLGVIFLLIHLGAMIAVYFVPIFWWLKMVFLFGVFTNLIIVIRTYVLLSNDSAIIGFALNEKNQWFLKSRSQELFLAKLDYPLFVANYLIIINFTLNKKPLKISLPIGRDGLKTDDFRKVKKLLKTSR